MGYISTLNYEQSAFQASLPTVAEHLLSDIFKIHPSYNFPVYLTTVVFVYY